MFSRISSCVKMNISWPRVPGVCSDMVRCGCVCCLKIVSGLVCASWDQAVARQPVEITRS